MYFVLHRGVLVREVVGAEGLDREREVHDLDGVPVARRQVDDHPAPEALPAARTLFAEIVRRADRPNLGIGLDSFHVLAANTALAAIDDLDPAKLFLVQLSDFMWQETRTFLDC